MLTPVFAALLCYLILQRVFELILAERNRRWALAQGGKEAGERHYPVIVAVHTLFFISLLLEWRYLARGWNALWPIWLGLLAASQILRAWTMRSLGRYWNTRIIVIPGMTLVTRGPYRCIRHPNYLVVIIELATIPLLCSAYVTAALFSVANALILVRRIPEEERALERASGNPLSPAPRLLPRPAGTRHGRGSDTGRRSR
jgi:methyltransferase